MPFALDATHTFDRTDPDGTTLPADQLATATKPARGARHRHIHGGIQLWGSGKRHPPLFNGKFPAVKTGETTHRFHGAAQHKGFAQRFGDSEGAAEFDRCPRATYPYIAGEFKLQFQRMKMRAVKHRHFV